VWGERVLCELRECCVGRESVMWGERVFRGVRECCVCGVRECFVG